MEILHNKTFLLGLLLGPIPWIILLILLGFSYRQVKAIREWYLGLPITQWPAMLLVVLGCKVLRTGKYCKFMQYEGRFWVSPMVEGFRLEPKDPREIV